MALAGFTFGPYELLARLPSSAPTQTFLARQRGADSFKKIVCLRTLLPWLAKDESVVETFVAEAKLAAHLAHPACVTIYDLGKERGAYFVSMEYVSGETLESLVDAALAARDPLSGPLVASIIAAACDGLTFAHALRDPTSGRGTGLVHGDLSPRNILVTYEGHTKILDFGITSAKAETRGRQRYAPPERLQGKALDRRSDVYALGLVLFEALAVRALGPIASEARTDWIPSTARAPKLSAIVPDIHPDLEAICERALAPTREARYQSADELAEALRAYITKVGATDRRTAIVERMQKLFEQRSALRQRTVQKLLRGDCTEEELEAELGARSVADLGLLFGPEPEAPPAAPPRLSTKHALSAALRMPVAGTAAAPTLPGSPAGDPTAEVPQARPRAGSSTDRWVDATDLDQAPVRPVRIPDEDAEVGIRLSSLGSALPEPGELEDRPTLPGASIFDDDPTIDARHADLHGLAIEPPAPAPPTPVPVPAHPLAAVSSPGAATLPLPTSVPPRASEPKGATPAPRLRAASPATAPLPELPAPRTIELVEPRERSTTAPRALAEERADSYVSKRTAIKLLVAGITLGILVGVIIAALVLDGR